MKTLSPSILAADMLNLGEEIEKIEKSGSKYVHIDIMDGVLRQSVFPFPKNLKKLAS